MHVYDLIALIGFAVFVAGLIAYFAIERRRG
jgi:hypothetical protein